MIFFFFFLVKCYQMTHLRGCSDSLNNIRMKNHEEHEAHEEKIKPKQRFPRSDILYNEFLRSEMTHKCSSGNISVYQTYRRPFYQ